MKDRASPKDKIYWVDLVRAVATFLVVTVHVSGQIINVWGQVPVRDWLIANVYGGVGRVCVPLFFMISGYLLLPRAESLGAFYRTRIPKVIIPLIAWSLIYLGWYCGNHPGACTPRFVQDTLLVRGTYYHLWFLRSLLGIYLVMPVLRLMIRPGTDQAILWYLIGLWVVFQSALTFAQKFWGFQIAIGVPLTAGFVGFFVLGYLLGGWTLSRFMIGVSAVAWLLSTLATVIGTYLTTRRVGQFDGYFYEFTTLNVIVASAAAFLLLRWIAGTGIFASTNVRNLIRRLASASFGIYLVHVLIIEVLQRWIPVVHLDSFTGNPLWSIPLVSAVVLLLSFFIVRILQKIPALRLAVPG